MNEKERKIILLEKNKKLWKFLYLKKDGTFVFKIKEYVTTYNPITEESSCTCPNSIYKKSKECYHIEFIKRIIKKLFDTQK